MRLWWIDDGTGEPLPVQITHKGRVLSLLTVFHTYTHAHVALQAVKPRFPRRVSRKFRIRRIDL